MKESLIMSNSNDLPQQNNTQSAPVEATPTVPQAPAEINNPAPVQTSLADKKVRSGVISELKQLQQDVKHFRASDLVVPIMSIIFLALLTSFVYIPMITKAIEFREKKDEIADKIVKLERVNTELSKIDVAALQSDLATSRSVIPFSLQVSDFVLYVNELAEDKNLEFKEILAGDIQVRSKGETREIDPVIKGVSGPLKYGGSLEDIVSFLDELQNISPYIISADNIELKQFGDEGDWELSLLITGFYMNKASLPSLDIYAPFSPYTQYEAVLNTFSSKAESSQ